MVFVMEGVISFRTWGGTPAVSGIVELQFAFVLGKLQDGKIRVVDE